MLYHYRQVLFFSIAFMFLRAQAHAAEEGRVQRANYAAQEEARNRMGDRLGENLVPTTNEECKERVRQLHGLKPFYMSVFYNTIRAHLGDSLIESEKKEVQTYADMAWQKSIDSYSETFCRNYCMYHCPDIPTPEEEEEKTWDDLTASEQLEQETLYLNSHDKAWEDKTEAEKFAAKVYPDSHDEWEFQ